MTTYVKTTKEAVMTALGAKFSAISGIAFVDYQRVYDQGIDKARCPGVYLNDVRIDKEKLLSDITKNEFTIGVVGFVWAEDDENLATILNTFLESCKDAVISDRSLGGIVYTTNIDVIETDGGNRHPQGMFVMMLLVTFFSSE